MMNIRIYTVASSLLIMTVPSAYGQQKECGTVISQAQYNREMARMKIPEAAAPAAAVLPYHLPVTIHICRQSDGTGGLTPLQLDSAMFYLNRGLNWVGFSFFEYGPVIYLDNDFFYTVLDSATRSQLRQQDPIPNTINVYFTNLDPTICGESSFPADTIQGILIDVQCAGSSGNPSSFPHEVGHYLDLYHTHETKFGKECPSENNCSTAGDRVCDTPADPNLSDSVNASCVYIGHAVPPAGCDATPYTPPVDNLMSYSAKKCRTNITAGQVARMMATMSGSRASLHAHVKYVDRDWAGTQTGSPQEPFTTVQAALAASAPGDFVFVKSGSYPETLTTSGTLSARIDRWDGAGIVVVGQ